MFEFNKIKIHWYGHDTFVLEKGIKICIDPYRLTKALDADLILISHNHFDHLSMDDLKKFNMKNTIILTANECKEQLSNSDAKQMLTLLPGEEKTVSGVKIKAVSAYNIDKINPDTKKPFHPKEDNKIGFVVTIEGTTIYHTGDSDFISEMIDLRPDVLLVPVSGTYVMTAKEAAKAVEKIKPKVAIPMHYGSIVGSEADAKEFKNLVRSCEVQILTKE